MPSDRRCAGVHAGAFNSARVARSAQTNGVDEPTSRTQGLGTGGSNASSACAGRTADRASADAPRATC